MNLIRITKVAGISLAMAITLGCGPSKPTVSEIEGRQEVRSVENEMDELCNEKFIDANFCGYGQGISNDESYASKLADQAAVAKLRGSVQTYIDNKMKTSVLQDPSYDVARTSAERTVSTIGGEVSDIRTQKTRIEREKDGRYIVHKLVTTSRNAALELAKSKLKASEELQQIQRSMNLSINIDRILDEDFTKK